MNTATDSVSETAKITAPQKVLTIVEALQQEPVIKHLNHDGVMLNKQRSLAEANASNGSIIRWAYRYRERGFYSGAAFIVAFFGLMCLSGKFGINWLTALFGACMVLSGFAMALFYRSDMVVLEWRRRSLLTYFGYVPPAARAVAQEVLHRRSGVFVYIDFLGIDPYLVAVREEYGKIVEEVYLYFWENPPQAPRLDRIFHSRF